MVGVQRRVSALSVVLLLVLTAGCGVPAAPTTSTLTLYTCVSDSTIQPVLTAFAAAHPDVSVQLFRAPTGQLNARVAADVRSGGLKADVVWACDPLTMQGYVDQHLVGGWTPQTDIPAQVRTPDYVGVAMLYLVAISRKGVPAPATWRDLAGAGTVAVPDPRVAASALGALGYFGPAFYADLKDHGAAQVSTPDDVTTGVATGRFDAGITIANSAYAAQKKGSPVVVTWPEPGAVAVYGPVAVSTTTTRTAAAHAFVEYVTSRPGQAVLAGAGSYPALPGVPGPTKPADARTVYPDWTSLAGRKTTLLNEYATIFGG
ncbi:MAG: extracellular solute-binding protein [Propionibacteriaceae bacterium]